MQTNCLSMVKYEKTICENYLFKIPQIATIIASVDKTLLNRPEQIARNDKISNNIIDLVPNGKDSS